MRLQLLMCVCAEIAQGYRLAYLSVHESVLIFWECKPGERLGQRLCVGSGLQTEAPAQEAVQPQPHP